jgi:hypothetical protein
MYNSLFYLGYTVEHEGEKEPTLEEMRAGLSRRLVDLLENDNELVEALSTDSPTDTYEI